VFLVVVALTYTIAAEGQTQSPADLVITNGRIYTVNSRQPWAEALAIRGDKIVAVGSVHDVAAFRGPDTKAIDAKGHLVLPGFTDCHIHFLDGSLSLLRVNVAEAKTLADIQKTVKEYADAHPTEAWILGRGWSYPLFAPSGLPDRKDLDAIISDRPVYLESYDGHSWWANTKALQMAGITKNTPDPANGKIVRDAATREPTGAIQEDAADELIRRAIPAPTRQQKKDAFKAGMREANKAGLVRVHSAGGANISSSDLQNVDLLEELKKNGELTLRMYLAYRLNPPSVSDEQLQEIEAARRRYHDEWISAGAVKFFMDGVVEGHTAAMLVPYSDDPKQIGTLFWDPGKYQQAVTELDKRGIQIFTHAIGDKAVRTVLDSYEQAAKTNHTSDVRHRIEHIETITAQDIPRFGKLGVIASMQPLHAYPDDDTLKIWARNAGPDRTSRAWPWRSIESSGGVLAFGSDWPVVTLNPWSGLQNALTRQTTEGEPAGGFVPKERVSLADAIRGYTLGAAYAGHREKTEGSLEPGKVADLIVVSQDIFNIEPYDIAKTEVLLTMVGGKAVYESPSWKSAAEAGGNSK
jgi:predicted amidohydrolase YtcJ